MVPLVLERVDEVSERRPARERAAHRRKPAPRRLPAPIGIAELRARDAAAWPRGGELVKGPDRVRFGVGIWIRDHDELTARLGDTAVDVGAEAERSLVLDKPSVCRQLDLQRDVRHHDQLLDLRCKRTEAAVQIGVRPVGDDDAGDAQSSSR